MVLWGPIRPYRTNTPKIYHFHYRGLECKSKKSRVTWSNRQIWPQNSKQSRSKANRVLSREHISHCKHPLLTTQEKTTHGHHQMVNTEIILIILCSRKWRSSIQPAKQDQELTVSQIMNSLLSNSD